MKSVLITLITLAAVATATTQDCATQFDICRVTNTTANCNAANVVCKDKCSEQYDDCNTSGLDSAVCGPAYGACLDAFTPFATGTDCVSKYYTCTSTVNGTDGNSDNSCSSENADCKDQCSIIV